MIVSGHGGLCELRYRHFSNEVIFPRTGRAAVTAEVPPATESLRATRDLPLSAIYGLLHRSKLQHNSFVLAEARG